MTENFDHSLALHFQVGCRCDLCSVHLHHSLGYTASSQSSLTKLHLQGILGPQNKFHSEITLQIHMTRLHVQLGCTPCFSLAAHHHKQRHSQTTVSTLRAHHPLDTFPLHSYVTHLALRAEHKSYHRSVVVLDIVWSLTVFPLRSLQCMQSMSPSQTGWHL